MLALLYLVLLNLFSAKAIKHSKLALQHDPTYYRAMHLLGNILQNMGKDTEAQKYFVQAAEMAASQQQAQESLAATPGTSSSSRPSVWNRLAMMAMSKGDELSVEVPLSGTSDGGNSVGSRTLTARCVSDRPRIIVVDEFLTPEECSIIPERSGTLLQPSHVMGGQAAEKDSAAVSGPYDGAYRVSDNAWLPPGLLNPHLTTIQQRLAAVTGIPVAYLTQMSEQLQV
jgi:hypothetical protein